MLSFVDEAILELSSGNGGNGSISFRREKYVPKGGPDGGDGGKGGDVVFIVEENLKTLAHLKSKRVFKAENGRDGSGRRKHGRNGNDVMVSVPPGTMIRNFETNEILYDFVTVGDTYVFFKGGHGGKGNWHYRSSKNQSPRTAQPGIEGEAMKIKVELNVIADIGFVGYPNAGKSTLLSELTNANPKIAAYEFTTKIPNLGVMDYGYKELLLADIPGIIEGASHGHGLGLEFLKHISRTKGLAFLVDVSRDDFLEIYKSLMFEIKEYGQDLHKKNRVVVATKLDLDNSEENFQKLKKELKDETVIGICSYYHTGLDDLRKEFLKLVE